MLKEWSRFSKSSIIKAEAEKVTKVQCNALPFDLYQGFIQ